MTIHPSSAYLTDLIRFLICDVDRLKRSLGLIHRCHEIRVEVSDDRLPRGQSSPTLSNRELQIRRESDIHDAREALLHDPVDNLAELQSHKYFYFPSPHTGVQRIVVIVGRRYSDVRCPVPPSPFTSDASV